MATTTPTLTDHQWARGAASCACDRAVVASIACGLVWRGRATSHNGFYTPRHPLEGGDPERYRRWCDEVDTALALQRLAGMA